MALLENPAENTCFGCGPSNPRGFHLNFEKVPSDDGTAEVRTRYTPKEEETGWPGILHHGLHAFLLTETSYWGAYALTGKVHRYLGPSTFDETRGLRVGKPFTMAARIVASEVPGVRIEARSENDRAVLCGRLTASFVPAHRSEVEQWHLKVPSYLLEDMDP